jgi:hypothetical protein
MKIYGNYRTTNCNPNEEENWRWISHTLRKPTRSIELALDWNPQGLEGAAVPKRPGGERSRKKPRKWGIRGARLKELLLIGCGGSVSQMPCAPEGATGMNNYHHHHIKRMFYLLTRNFSYTPLCFVCMYFFFCYFLRCSAHRPTIK